MGEILSDVFWVAGAPIRRGSKILSNMYYSELASFHYHYYGSNPTSEDMAKFKELADAFGSVTMGYYTSYLIGGFAESVGKFKGAASGYPTTRTDLHNDLTNKGYTAGTPSPNGYVTYKGPDGRTVTIKPSGEVIPTQQVKIDPNNPAWNAPRYPQRQYYDGTPIPNGSHSTGHFVEPFKK